MLIMLFKVFIILNSTVLTSIVVYSKEICPRVCVCDVFEGQKRADCSEQHLVSAEINLAKSVEILNLSGNDITTVDNHNFKEYDDLINLSLAKNSIHTLGLFAFENLEKLKHLDLSENRLEFMDDKIIESNIALTYLDLSRNKFMMLDDKPLLISASLEFLSLRSSHLSHIYDSFFSEMPKIIDLDLSDNLLNTLQSTIFDPLEKIQYLNIEYNSFTCDSSLEHTLKVLKIRRVFVKTDKCNKHSKKVMFEKMIMLDTSEKETKEDVEIERVWGGQLPSVTFKNITNISNKSILKQKMEEYFIELKDNREEQDDCLNDEFMSLLCECRQNFIFLYETQIAKTKAIEIRLYAVLYVGIFIGAVSGCFIFYIFNAVKKKCGNAITKQMKRQEIRDRIVRNHEDDIRRRRNDSQDQPLISNIINVQDIVRTSHNLRHRNDQTERIIGEPSATAQLVDRLFRDRDRNISEIIPIPESPVQRRQNIHNPQTVQTDSFSSYIAVNRSQTEFNRQIEIHPDEENQEHQNERSDIFESDAVSEYASALGDGSILNIDRSCTPPPAYREIFE
ncbi:unnamed protein product [Chironomus riparius]|uniref:Uncharacterized protein n=1 Tax=Chironomus riparius TaxID=315576 RepID=A0A9N9RSW3_9DIPT|nr:unnamed protein product [Chironomus riparius]